MPTGLSAFHLYRETGETLETGAKKRMATVLHQNECYLRLEGENKAPVIPV